MHAQVLALITRDPISYYDNIVRARPQQLALDAATVSRAHAPPVPRPSSGTRGLLTTLILRCTKLSRFFTPRTVVLICNWSYFKPISRTAEPAVPDPEGGAMSKSPRLLSKGVTGALKSYMPRTTNTRYRKRLNRRAETDGETARPLTEKLIDTWPRDWAESRPVST